MSDIQKPNTGVSNNIDIDTFKSLYYLLNAKPDSQIRLLHTNKQIEINDINELNSLVVEKLRTEALTTSITTISLVFRRNKINTYNNWAEFERTNWNISEQTLSISINWDISLKLPEHELPQKHTLKVRLGSPIRPNEIFQLMMTSDKDEDLLEATSNGVCKVDFINNVIANELLSIVENWYESLPNNVSGNRFIKFSEKYRRHIAFLINALIPISAIMLSYNIIARTILNSNNWDNISMKNLLFIFSIGISLIYLSDTVARIISNRIYKQIGEYSDYPMFKITKGDKNSITDIDRKNNKVKSSILTQFTISMIVGIISLFLGKLLEAFF